MAELDSITVYNPLEEDFTVPYNGEPYTIPAESQKSWAQHLAYHAAKHLSNEILSKEVLRIKKKKSDNPYRPELAQLMIHDNVKRRKALYDVLKDKDLVEECVKRANLKSFIGDMKEYDEYVEKRKPKARPTEDDSDEKSEDSKEKDDKDKK